MDLGVIKKSGAWLEFNGEKIGQGKDAARMYIKENPKISAEIEKSIRNSIKEKSDIPLNIGTKETEKASVEEPLEE